MKILENTLKPEITGTPNHHTYSGGSYYIEAIGGHLDIEWGLDDLIEAYQYDETLAVLLTYKVKAQIPPAWSRYLSIDDMLLDFEAHPDSLNVIRITVSLSAGSDSFGQWEAIELGYKPDRWEVTPATLAGFRDEEVA